MFQIFQYIEEQKAEKVILSQDAFLRERSDLYPKNALEFVCKRPFYRRWVVRRTVSLSVSFHPECQRASGKRLSSGRSEDTSTHFRFNSIHDPILGRFCSKRSKTSLHNRMFPLDIKKNYESPFFESNL